MDEDNEAAVWRGVDVAVEVTVVVATAARGGVLTVRHHQHLPPHAHACVDVR
jgi:hypothetical protein